VPLLIGTRVTDKDLIMKNTFIDYRGDC